MDTVQVPLAEGQIPMNRSRSRMAQADDIVEEGIGVEGLHFSYNRRSPDLFGGLTHRFLPGQTTSLVGESGSGKSTLLYLMGLMLTPSSGRVLLDGKDVSGARDADRSRIRAERFGFVFQDAQLDPSRRILQCVIEPGLYAGGTPSFWKPRAMELLQTFGLSDLAASKPLKISGGQAGRIAICRALLVKPTVVFADEPTGNLDRANAELVLDALTTAAASGCTVIIATHDPFVVEHTDQVVSL